MGEDILELFVGVGNSDDKAASMGLDKPPCLIGVGEHEDGVCVACWISAA